MNRRQLLLATGVGAIAVAGGAALYKMSSGDRSGVTPGQGQASSPPPATTAGKQWPAGSALAGLRFERPEGGELAMDDVLGQWTLLNFWATWCAPCIKEMPLLDGFAKASLKWQVVGLAIDGPTPVRQFLAQRPVSFPIGLAGMDGLDLVKALGNTGGQLPFTVLISPQGEIIERHLGALNGGHLSAWSRLAAERQ